MPAPMTGRVGGRRRPIRSASGASNLLEGVDSPISLLLLYIQHANLGYIRIAWRRGMKQRRTRSDHHEISDREGFAGVVAALIAALGDGHESTAAEAVGVAQPTL